LLSRRSVVAAAVDTATTITSAVLVVGGCSGGGLVAHAAVPRAVGSGEENCRRDGTCLEKLELDGLVGWEWGGRDRCDALDPLCGANGRLRETPIVGNPVPPLPTGTDVVIRHVAAIQIDIGRDESGVLNLGFYDAPTAAADALWTSRYVEQMVQFLSGEGLSSTTAPDTIGLETMGVSLTRGGVLTNIVPAQAITLGVPSQGYAYARAMGRAKVGEDFVPQGRPKALSASPFGDGATVLRLHDCAGLISVPEKGVGYGGTGFEGVDECFESAFVITASPVPEFDGIRGGGGARRIVIGQVLDGPGMAFLERLANLPTQRGLRGVIPGQTSGPPLPKVTVRRVQVGTVTT
jgi:hypothetical protein